jgi:hypothetical protein
MKGSELTTSLCRKRRQISYFVNTILFMLVQFVLPLVGHQMSIFGSNIVGSLLYNRDVTRHSVVCMVKNVLVL